MDSKAIHETDDRLELYAMNRLAEREIAEVEEHLLFCSACRDRLDETANYILGMRAELVKPMPVAEARDWFAWLRPRFAMAGAFAAVVLAIGIYWVGGRANLTPVATLQLVATRGSDTGTVQSARETDLVFSEENGAALVAVTDSSGSDVWTGTAEQQDGKAVAKVRKTLSPGKYFVSVSSASGQILHQYEFQVRK